MAQIAEDLLLLLLDNASAQPALNRDRRDRVLSAAVLLDLARAGRIRPAVPGEHAQTGRLLVLMGPDPLDPVLSPALKLLARRPLRPATAVAKMRRGVESTLLAKLERAGQIRAVHGPNRSTTWPFVDRDRVNSTRAAVLAALFDQHAPAPTTAAIISLLHAVDGLHVLLSLNERGWRWVDDRAGEIASGSWLHESRTGLHDVNLAVTASALRPVLA
jgi:hypothetical protein